MKSFCALLSLLGIPASFLCLVATLYQNPNASMQQTNQTIAFVVCGLTFLAVLGYFASPRKPEQPSKYIDQNGMYYGPEPDFSKHEPIPSFKEIMREENATTDQYYNHKSLSGGAYHQRDDGGRDFKGGSDSKRPREW